MINRCGCYYEDFTVDATYATDGRTITEADYVAFTTSFGFFEPLFMDRTYVVRETPYAQAIVPGAMTFAVAEGLTILSGIIHRTGLAFLGADMRVDRPVLIGDTITVMITVVEKRPTRKTDRGIVTFAHRVTNQNGEAVMAYTVRRMIRRRR